MDPSPDILRFVVEKLDLGATFFGWFSLSVSHMWIFLGVHQTSSNLPSINRASLQLRGPAEVWIDALQRPVEISYVLTTPASSLEIAM